jgi:hypothetical protein
MVFRKDVWQDMVQLWYNRLLREASPSHKELLTRQKYFFGSIMSPPGCLQHSFLLQCILFADVYIHFLYIICWCLQIHFLSLVSFLLCVRFIEFISFHASILSVVFLYSNDLSGTRDEYDLALPWWRHRKFGSSVANIRQYFHEILSNGDIWSELQSHIGINGNIFWKKHYYYYYFFLFYFLFFFTLSPFANLAIIFFKIDLFNCSPFFKKLFVLVFLVSVMLLVLLVSSSLLWFQCCFLMLSSH